MFGLCGFSAITYTYIRYRTAATATIRIITRWRKFVHPAVAPVNRTPDMIYASVGLCRHLCLCPAPFIVPSWCLSAFARASDAVCRFRDVLAWPLYCPCPRSPALSPGNLTSVASRIGAQEDTRDVTDFVL